MSTRRSLNQQKTVFQSKTVMFFLVAMLYTFLEGILANQSNNIIDLKLVNWELIIASLGGLVLRFFTNKPIKR